jgi:transcriptional regulator with XRE-family HTH domain
MPSPRIPLRWSMEDIQTILDLRARGLTQVRIAAYVGCSQMFVSKVLTGRTARARKLLKELPPDTQR